MIHTCILPVSLTKEVPVVPVPRLYGKIVWSEVPATSVPLFYSKTVVYWRGCILYRKIPYNKPGAILMGAPARC